MCDPIWHVSSRSGEACCELLYPVTYLLTCVACRSCSDDERFISFEEAVAVLRDQLSYPDDRALHFVQKFDRNGDGRLSVAEFSLFKKKIEES